MIIYNPGLVGNSVKVSIIGVNSYRFGTLSGALEFIEPGTLQNESSGEVVMLYRARIRLHETSLISKSGEEIVLLPIASIGSCDISVYIKIMIRLCYFT